MTIEVFHNERVLLECSAIISVPRIALNEAGHIRCLAADRASRNKHQFHALGQMALFQFDDGDITPIQCAGPLHVRAAGGTLALDDGILICRAAAGDLAVFSNTDRPARKYLEAANRFCTRWVRLDI